MYTMNAKEYNEKVMKGHFRKVYPVIADQILRRTGVVAGSCLDLGGGPGMLGVSLAMASDLRVVIVDPLPECVCLAGENIHENRVSGQVSALVAAAESLPFEDGSIDLVASRGSVFFWEDQRKGIAEVFRVLRPGGWAYIGGGFGTVELLHEVQAARADDPDWDEQRRKRLAKSPPGHFETILEELGISGLVERGEAGVWIIFQKP